MNRQAPSSGCPTSLLVFANLVSDAALLLTTAGEASFANTSWCRHTGLREGSSNGHGWLLAVEEAQRDEVLRRWREAAAAGEGFSMNVPLKLAGGRIRHVPAACRPVQTGEPDSLWIGVFDIAEALASTQEECELQETRIRLEAALAATGMGVWELDPTTDEASWHGATYEQLGLVPDRGQPRRGEMYRRFMLPEDRSMVENAIARCLLERGEFAADYRVVRPDGQVRWRASRGRFVPGVDGRHDRIIGVNFDITERKGVEQALRDNEARRNEFLAMLAHELRNPLAPITNAVHLLERHAERPELVPMATQIVKRQVALMARLVDDLLEASRITQGRVELRKENLLAATAVLPAVESVRPMVREHRQMLVVDVPTNIDLVADQARLVQIVANLLNNASKYTPDGGRIDVTARSDGDDWLEIEVRDNGMGIDPELLPRIFDLFSQGDRTLDRARGGLGIGLSVVKRLVDLHGGTIRADSAGPGTGAAFTVRLPRQERREVPRHPVTGKSTASIPPTAILVADDNRDAAVTMATVLEADGHRVRMAFDGQEALRAAREFRPAIALLDIGMPGLTGLEVARAIRADPSLHRTVMIALTGYGQITDRQESRLAGFDAHLSKPAELRTLYQAVYEAKRARERASP